MRRGKSHWSVTYRSTSFGAVGELIIKSNWQGLEDDSSETWVATLRLKCTTGDTWTNEPADRLESVETSRGSFMSYVQHATLAMQHRNHVAELFPR